MKIKVSEATPTQSDDRGAFEMKTTLNQIRKHSPCESSWKALMQHLGKTKADDEPLAILEILDVLGLDDALWCLRAVDGYDKEIRLFGVWCARQVQHLMTDKRGLDALDVAERFAHGTATKDELDDARATASAVRAVRAVRAAAGDAASSAAGDAASSAARAAAWAAAYAASSAAYAASSAAASSARAAASDAARAAAYAARNTQEAHLREVLAGLSGGVK